MDIQGVTSNGHGKNTPQTWKSGHYQAYKVYAENPFEAEGVTEKWIDKPGHQTSMVAVNPETGETMQLYVAPKKIKVAHDPMTYGKVMRNGKVDELSAGAKVILLYAAFFIKMNKCEMELYYTRATKWCRIQKSVFYKAIAELLDADIIAIKDKNNHIFWVNPNYVFNGNRTKLDKKEGRPDRLKELAGQKMGGG